MAHRAEIGETVEEMYKSGDEIRCASGAAQITFDENNIIRGEEALKIAGDGVDDVAKGLRQLRLHPLCALGGAVEHEHAATLAGDGANWLLLLL